MLAGVVEPNVKVVLGAAGEDTVSGRAGAVPPGVVEPNVKMVLGATGEDTLSGSAGAVLAGAGLAGEAVAGGVFGNDSGRDCVGPCPNTNGFLCDAEAAAGALSPCSLLRAALARERPVSLSSL